MRLSTLPLVLSLALALGGCQLTAIPHDIERYREEARALVPVLDPVLEPADVIFRQGHFRVFLGIIPYSQALAHWTESDFSHVGIVWRRVEDGWLVVDVGPYGIQRRHLVDFLIEGPEHVVVKRLAPEHADRRPAVLAELELLIDGDVLHDFPYGSDDGDFYCAEAIDHVYRQAGVPLAPLIPIEDLPRIDGWPRKWFYCLVALMLGADLDDPVVVPGNESLGLYSSPYLVEVINLIPRGEDAARKAAAVW